jgi:hypothetical protein
VADASNGDECGALKLYVAENDGTNTVGLALTGSTTDGEIDVTVGAGTASVVTVPGHIDLAGDIDVDGTLEADAITIGSTAIGSIYGVIAGSSSIVTTGALNSGSITSGFGNIDNGSSTLDTGAATLASLNVSDGNITNVGDIAVDTVSGDADSNTTIGFPGSDILTLNTAGSERARIDANGQLLVGRTSANTYFHTNLNSSGANVGCLTLEHTSSTDSECYGQDINFSAAAPDNESQWFFRCRDSGATPRFQIWSSGNCINVNNSYGAVSDEKLKTGIVDARSYWADFKNVQFRKFKLKSKGENGTYLLGVIAQEIETIFPSLVEESPDFDESDGKREDLGTTTKSVKYSVLNQIGLKVVQELQTRLEAAEAKITTLEAA